MGVNREVKLLNQFKRNTHDGGRRRVMRQAVQMSFVGHCSLSVTVPVAFHILLVRTAVYCHINMCSFLPEEVTVINAL